MLSLSQDSKAPRIRELNDSFRTTFVGGAVLVTAAFEALPVDLKARVLQRVRTFEQFDDDNDPYHEHDMAFFDEGGERFFFKLDYYSPDSCTGERGLTPTNADHSNSVRNHWPFRQRCPML